MAQVQMAKRLGIFKAALCEIEKGRSLVSPQAASRYAKKAGFSETVALEACFQDQLRQFQVDAFSVEPFKGNPAAVVPLDRWLPDEIMQSMALENNLSETAFFVPDGDRYTIRWFTPTTEVDLCGHATLATAFVILNELTLGKQRVDFTSMSGPLAVEHKEDRYILDFPSRSSNEVSLPSGLESALGVRVLEAHMGRRDLLVVVEDENTVKSLAPDFNGLMNLDVFGVLVTAKGDSADFVSRCFFPREGIPEDPVTGSAHCALVPFWASRLGKTSLFARQISNRGGELWCELAGDRVRIGGQAVKVMESTWVFPKKL